MNREEKLNVIEMKLKKFMDSHIIVADLIEQVLTGCKKYGFIAIEKEQIKEEIQDEIQQNQEKEKINVYQEKIFLNDEKLNPHQNYPIQIVEGSQQPEREQNYAQQQELQMREQYNNGMQQSIEQKQDGSQKNQRHKKLRNKKPNNQHQEICIYCDKKFKNFITYVQHLYLRHDIKLTSKDLEPFQQENMIMILKN
ncbi:hypothetical protein pb186bvf_009073 [Paramecium bursaria]